MRSSTRRILPCLIPHAASRHAPTMQTPPMRRTLLASPRELDPKLELLQQLGYESRYSYGEDSALFSEKDAFPYDTDQWIQSEYNWALEEAAEPPAGIPDLFDGAFYMLSGVSTCLTRARVRIHVAVEEDEEACLPYVYDPTFFAGRQSMPSTPRMRSQSLQQLPRADVDKVCSAQIRFLALRFVRAPFPSALLRAASVVAIPFDRCSSHAGRTSLPPGGGSSIGAQSF